MSVEPIEPGGVPSERTAGTGALAASGAALTACAACCTLPLMLPAAVLAGSGGALAWIAGVQVWVVAFAVLTVAAAWTWLVVLRRRTGQRLRRSTLIMMSAATLSTTLAVGWAALETGALK